MVATFPDSTRAFVRRVDLIDLNAAGDINDLQDEVVAVQKTLGRNPHISAKFASATTVAERLTMFEDNVIPRVTTLEQRLRRAAVSVRRASTLQVNSSAAWQNIVLPDVASSLNDYGTPAQLYDAATGRFFSVADSPAIWSFSASITWHHPSTLTVAGVRGLQLVTAGGTVLDMDKRAALPGEDQTLRVSWTGRLTADPTFYVSLQVRQTQGTALFLQADSATTPHRADFTHIPG